VSKHYDVVVLGAGVGALATAALLARRSWRVLVLGHGYKPATYAHDGIRLARRPFTLLAGSSPAWGKLVVELAQSQTFKRRTTPLDPMLQILAPRLRLELPPDLGLFGKEIDREYPEVRRIVDELYAELARTNAAADAAFERDVVWPPGTFWEKRETGRALSTLPHLHEDDAREFLAEFPRDHDYRSIVEIPAQFASHLVHMPAFAVARLHGAWTRGVSKLASGEDDLVEFLCERVRAHGGEAKLGERATRVAQKNGRVTGVHIDGDEAPTGVQFLVTDVSTRALLDLAPDFDPPRRALTALPRLLPREFRFVVSIIVKDEGVPEALADESFVLPSWPHRGFDPSKPMIHLQRRANASGLAGTTLLVAEALFPDDAPVPIGGAREAVLAALEQFLPFIKPHYVVVDSPHDGRPLWDFRSGERRQVDRASLRVSGGSLDAEPMVPRWEADPRAFYGLAAEPLRSPLAGAFVVGPSVLPALGQEGELIAAWGVARMITKTDRKREKMRRDMWSKIELG
jgi:phytoene dehydrogenase-like protein